MLLRFVLTTRQFRSRLRRMTEKPMTVAEMACMGESREPRPVRRPSSETGVGGAAGPAS